MENCSNLRRRGCNSDRRSLFCKDNGLVQLRSGNRLYRLGNIRMVCILGNRSNRSYSSRNPGMRTRDGIHTFR